MNMRVGLVLAKSPSYSETFFRSKINGLQQSGFEVILFVQQLEPGFDLCEVREAPSVSKNSITIMFSILGTYFKLLPHLRKILRFWKLERSSGKSVIETLKSCFLNAHILSTTLDWLHFGFATMALERENLAHAIGAKMAVSFRGYDINVYPIKNPNCYQLLWQRLDKVHSISHYLRNEALKLGLKKETPYEIITPALVLDKIPNHQAKGAFSNPIHIVTVARLQWIKGIDIAIKSMQLLKDKGVAFRYSIIGEGAKTFIERYNFMVRELGLKDHVYFAGKLSHEETLKHISKADIYLQPSLNEGFCNAVLEAQALGKLCIASNVGGLPENIIEGETGFLFKVGNPTNLFEVLLEVIELSPQQRLQILNQGKERVKKHFGIELQQQQFLEFYSI